MIHFKETMSDEAAKLFVASCDRAEAHDNPVAWCKAIRVVLYELGFKEDWVNENFRNILEEFYYGS